MPQFKYRARTTTGELVSGIMEAPSFKDLENLLAQRKFLLIDAQEAKKGFLSWEVSFRFGRGVKPTQLILFTRQLSALLRAGVPITQALLTLSEQTENRTLRTAILQIREDIERGASFGSALERQSHIFSDLYVSTVRVGEEAGNLEEVLDRVADFLEREMDIKIKVRSALLYPFILVIVASGLITFLVTYVLPKFRKVFYAAKVPLPLPTMMMFKLSEFFQRYWYYGLAGLIILIVAYVIISRTERGKEVMDEWKLRMPLFGPLLKKVGISRFARSLETMVRSGVDLGRSFQVIKGSIGNAVLAKVMDVIRENVMRGGSISEPLRRSKEFPPMVAHMIAVGEETGDMEDMLRVISNNYDKEVDFAIKIMTSTLEPLLLIVMGGIVLFIALSLYLPLFKMAKIIQYY
ncbi:type II secretion system F family protein [Candidatus Calescamantes bacterium]|nr:type II secretion system F family protein [Candidatus Calescamantes bacterium]